MINQFIKSKKHKDLYALEEDVINNTMEKLPYVKEFKIGKVNSNHNPARKYKKVVHIDVTVNEAEYVAEVLVTGKKLKDIQPLNDGGYIYYHIQEI